MKAKSASPPQSIPTDRAAEQALMSPDAELVHRLESAGQSHVLRFWEELSPTARQALVQQIQSVDWPSVSQLVNQLASSNDSAHLPDEAPIEPVPVHRLPQTDSERAAQGRLAQRGEAMLEAGQVAVVLVAGGQGTRLGFDGPKGTYPIGPVTGASLFQIHAEKIVALGRRHGRSIPLFIMTSPDNHDATVAFFEAHDRFGLEHVRFFTQGQMPAVDRETGRVLMADKGSLALSPDGHGGTIRALAAPGPNGSPSCLAEMAERGIRTVFYFQVDNPLVDIADPVFLGIHQKAGADVSFKVVEKVAPGEKVGVVVQAGGVPRVIEYSDLPAELAERRTPDGRLAYWAGSIAIHLFERTFLDALAAGDLTLPFHRALKKVKHIDAKGTPVDPSAPNAIKFETFIFDALPLAKRWTVVETDRVVEFEPLKNATGPDSPETVRQRMSDQFADWLEAAGARVARKADGSVAVPIEISPLFAMDAGELKSRLSPGLEVDQPLSLR